MQHLLLRPPELLEIRWHVVVAQCESRTINPAKKRCDATRLRRDLCTYTTITHGALARGRQASTEREVGVDAREIKAGEREIERARK